jgi:hypothetical protein
MGAVDDPRHVIDGGNLFLFEQRQKLLILSRVGTCCATANNRGGQHYRSANQSVCEAGDAGAHGRISISSESPARHLIESTPSGNSGGVWRLQ